MSKTENLTPERMKCTIGVSCPSLHRLEDGRLLVVGAEARTRAVELPSGHFQDQTIILGLPVAHDEAAIVIFPALLDTYVEEKVAEARDAEKAALESAEAMETLSGYADMFQALLNKGRSPAYANGYVMARLLNDARSQAIRALTPSTHGDA